MTKNYSFVSQINQELNWAFTDQEVQAFKMLAMVARPVTAEVIAERYGLEENDDFMTALRDTMGEED